MRKVLRRNFRIAKYVVYKETMLDKADLWWTFIGSFLGIALIGIFHSGYFDANDSVFLIGSFGASAVLLFGAVNSPLTQPRNLILGHLVSAIVGVTIHKIFPDDIWLSSSLAVSLSIVSMQITKSLHPPGGATALIANIGSEKIKMIGYGYVFFPVLSGVLILFIVALVVNNIPANRRYPLKRKSFKRLFTFKGLVTREIRPHAILRNFVLLKSFLRIFTK